MPKRYAVLSVLLLFVFIPKSLSQKSGISPDAFWIKGQADQKKDSAKLKAAPPKDYLNFNPSVDFTADGVARKKNAIVNRQSSLFVVFQSDVADENELLDLKMREFKASLTNLKLVTYKEEVYTKAIPKKGVLLSHLFNKNSMVSNKKGSLHFSEMLYDDPQKKNKLFELVYLPKVANRKEKEIIESYLSVKYGISLIGDRNYLNSDADTIWDHKTNRQYKFRVTGIGRDDALALNQKQSGNSEKDGLYIGLKQMAVANSLNKGTLADKQSLLWADDNGKTTFDKKSPSGQPILSRTWKAQLTGKKPTIAVQIKLDKLEMNLDKKLPEGEFLWLVMDTVSTDKIDYQNAVYIKSSLVDESQAVFDNVAFNTPSTLFSFAKGAELLAVLEAKTPSCLDADQKGSVTVRINGGTAPYKIMLKGAQSNREMNTDRKDITIDNLEEGSYSVSISDRFSSQQGNFIIDRFSENTVSLSQKWILERGDSVTIVPQTDAQPGTFKYEWRLGDKIISYDPQLLADTVGSYSMTATNAQGCSKTFPFTVESPSIAANQYAVYPNPCRANDIFTIGFDYEIPSRVKLSIVDINGKLLLSKDMGTVTKAEVKERIAVAGTYLIIVSRDNVSQTSRLIIY